jgi:hypothetical protein
MDYQVWNRGMQKSTYNKKKDIFMTWKTETWKKDKFSWSFSYLETGSDWQIMKASEVYCCWVSVESRKTEEVVEQ